MQGYNQSRAAQFPFLLGGAFIEANKCTGSPPLARGFPFLLGGAFIEAPFPRRSF